MAAANPSERTAGALRPSAATSPALLALLLVLGAASAEAAWRLLPVGLQAVVAGMAMSFCFACAAYIWALRDKADAALDAGGATSSQEYQRIRLHAALVRRRMMLTSVASAALAVLANSAAMAQQLTSAVWHWMPYAATLAVALCAFGYLLAHEWDEQLRAYRDLRNARVLQETVARAMEEALRRSRLPDGTAPAQHELSDPTIALQASGTGVH